MSTTTEQEPETRELSLQDKLQNFVTCTEHAIVEVEQKYKGLQVLDLNDREQIKAVTAGHIEVKKMISAVESTRKELKEDALLWGRTVDSTAKRLKAPLEAVADCLKIERDKADAEKARVKEEKQREAQEQLQSRVDALAKVQGDTSQLAALATMTDQMFERMLEKRTADYQEEIEARAWREEAANVSVELARQDVAMSIAEVMAVDRDQWPELVANAMSDKVAADRKRGLEEAERASAEEMSARLSKLDMYVTSRQLLDAGPEAWPTMLKNAEEAKAKAAEAERQQQLAEVEALKEQTRKAEAERQRLEDEKAAAAEVEMQRLQDEAVAAAAAEADKKRIAEEAEEAERQREAEEQRQARAVELLPDKKKLEDFAHTVGQLAIPSGLRHYNEQLNAILFEAAHRIRDFAEDLE